MRFKIMIPKVYFYSVSFAFALCILLIISGNHYTDNSFIHQNPESSETFKSEEYVDEDTLDLYSSSPHIENILNLIRERIEKEFSIYKFRYVGEGNVKSLIPETGGQPFRSVIVSTWRSGTTFLGEILNAVPGNFYHYEPLLSFNITQIRGLPLSDPALERLRNMMNCDFSRMPEYFEYGKTHFYQFTHNTRLVKYCKGENNLCFDAEFTSKVCKLFPFQSMKLVRLRLHLMEELLQDPGLNFKVILLVRDPRGVMQSRQHREFCPLSPDCWEPELLCADMINDYVAAARIMKLFPNRLMVIRHEDLALNPLKVTNDIFKFFNMTVPQSVREFLQTHTNNEVTGMFSTFRVSEKVPFKWKDLLDYDYIEKIEMSCSEAMDLWGYKMAYNESHLKSYLFHQLPYHKYEIEQFKYLKPFKRGTANTARRYPDTIGRFSIEY